MLHGFGRTCIQFVGCWFVRGAGLRLKAVGPLPLDRVLVFRPASVTPSGQLIALDRGFHDPGNALKSYETRQMSGHNDLNHGAFPS
jgi:hypothetical protein